MSPAPSTRQSPRHAASPAPLGRRLLKIGLAFVTSALLLNALVGARGLPAVLQARREYGQVERTLDRLRTENAQLRHEVARLRDDSTAVEEIARRDLGYIAPGEKVFIIRDVTPGEAPPAAASKPDQRAAPRQDRPE